MSKTLIPNSREAVILSLLSSGELYGREIRNRYQTRTKQEMPLGSLYTTLDRMEEKGFIQSREGEATEERGWNKRKYYKITALGITSLKAFQILMLEGGSLENA